MIGSNILQNAYNNLYKEIRKYIWSFEAVNAIADLEISAYQSFADIVAVRKNLDRVKSYARDVLKDDEDLQKVFDAFYDLREDEDRTYVKLTAVKEEVN